MDKLTSDDVEDLVKSVESRQIESTPLADRLLRSGLFFCGKTKKMRHLEQVAGQFDDSLDIRSFLSVQKNL